MFDVDVDIDSVLRATDPATISKIMTGNVMHGAIEREMQATRDRAKASTDFKDQSGELRKGITYEISVAGLDIIARLYAPAPYSGFLEDGTGAHDIVPVKARILRWDADGNTYWARKVHHPGTRARKILATAINLDNLAAAAAGATVEVLKG